MKISDLDENENKVDGGGDKEDKMRQIWAKKNNEIVFEEIGRESPPLKMKPEQPQPQFVVPPK